MDGLMVSFRYYHKIKGSDVETILNKRSAEGKAIQRLKDIDNADEWITVVAKDETIDLEELDRKISEFYDSI